MEEKCPECGELLKIKTIKKELGLGSIDYPVAQICPKCNWNKDLTGASDIVSKPIAAGGDRIKNEEEDLLRIISTPPKVPPKKSPSSGINILVTLSLVIIVLGGLIWAFYPTEPEQAQNGEIPQSAPEVLIAETPVHTPTITPAPEVTPTGKKVLVKLDRHRGFFNLIQGSQKISTGDEVIWTNDGTDPITLMSSDGLFEARLLDNGKRTNYTFKKPGTYGFYLKENNNLTGSIVVEP